MDLSSIGPWLVSLSLRYKILLLATAIFLVEIVLRYGAPRSKAYARWTAAFQAVGKVWTVVLLSIIYFLSVGPVSLTLHVLGKDPLGRRPKSDASFWHRHDPSPLDPMAAARHQF